MEFEHIRELLNKYWDCETSVSEEKELQDFFSAENDIPPDLQPYAPLFGYRLALQSSVLSDAFDDRLDAKLKNIKGHEYITIKIFRPLLHVAASVVLVAGLGVSLFFIAKQNNKPRFAETYNDPDAALKQVTFALEKLSEALQTGEDASRKTLQNIEEIGIDWSMLDSLSAPVPVAAAKEEATTVGTERF